MPHDLLENLSISASEGDHAALRRLSCDMGYELATANCCSAGLVRLAQRSPSIVVCDAALPDGGWKDILKSVKDSSAEPLLIVTSRMADESLWAEVLNFGGFDVIPQPFEPQEVRHVLESAYVVRSGAVPALSIH